MKKHYLKTRSTLRFKLKRSGSMALLLLALGSYTAKAQESVNSSGGMISNADKTVNYSVGQMIYSTIQGANATLYQGISVRYRIWGLAPVKIHSSLKKNTSFNLPKNSVKLQFFKRLFDLLASFLVIFCLLFWLIPVLGIIILIDSKGPIIFKQLRHGHNKKIFVCYKLRTMYPYCNETFNTVNKKDITKVGAFLRKYSLDELPQFYNILLGDMSIVGPRPHMLVCDAFYEGKIKGYPLRFYVKPGLTGWAQVNGLRGDTKTIDKMEERIKKDVFYIKNQSFFGDLKIIFCTILRCQKIIKIS